MAKIEYVARLRPKRGKDFICLSSNHFWRSEQYRRVEISLQGNLMADKPTGFSNIHCPVKAYRVATAVCDTSPTTIRRPW